MTTTALTTGANRGIGLEVARQLGALGMTTLIAARDPLAGKHAVAELRAEGLDADLVVLDVDYPASIAAAAAAVAADHGRLDVLVNSAGILPEATATDAASPLDLGLFRRTFETNLFGAVGVIQAFLPLVRASPAGRIVNVSTTMGSLADQSDPTSPYHGLVMPAYQTSKAALNGVTIALAKVLADTPVKVNSVCPGWVQTDLGGADNRAAAPLTADVAAVPIVAMATLDEDGPSGTFVDRDGQVAW